MARKTLAFLKGANRDFNNVLDTLGRVVTTQSGTAAEDLTGNINDLIWYSNAAQAGEITLPQATAANAGMVIKIIVGTTSWSTTAFKLGFDNAGSTVLSGQLYVVLLMVMMLQLLQSQQMQNH